VADNIGDATLDQTFVYDQSGNGNLTSQTGLGAYTYPLATVARPHAPLSAGAKTFSYDANGNMIGDGTRSLGVACPRAREARPGERRHVGCRAL
jgi:uncharacterized protein RhaS with RHS repeats